MAENKEKWGASKWRPAPEGLVANFHGSLASLPAAQQRQMFGYPAAFAGGNMFAGLHQESFVLRLSPDDRRQLLERAGARVFEPMPGRPMREYVIIPESLLQDETELKRWLAKALTTRFPCRPKPQKSRISGWRCAVW